MTTPSPREAAMIAGERYYNDDKPCRRGHLSKRYTSTGNCYECQLTHTAANKDKRNEMTKLANARRFNDSNSFVLSVVPTWTNTFRLLQDIMLCDDTEAKEVIMQQIRSTSEALRDAGHRPRIQLRPANSLARDEILQVLTYEGGIVTNYTSQEIREDAQRVSIKLMGAWYDAVEVMAVLREKQDYVIQLASM